MLWTGEREAGRDRDRIVNLSDGVFAIAITLLVLDIHVPDIPENVVASELPAALLALWPKYLGYFLSFVGISTFWMIHHSIFRPIRAYDRVLLYLNFLFLMAVAFLEFPTSLVGHYSEEQVSVVIHALNAAVASLLLITISWYAAREGIAWWSTNWTTKRRGSVACRAWRCLWFSCSPKGSPSSEPHGGGDVLLLAAPVRHRPPRPSVVVPLRSRRCQAFL